MPGFNKACFTNTTTRKFAYSWTGLAFNAFTIMRCMKGQLETATNMARIAVQYCCVVCQRKLRVMSCVIIAISCSVKVQIEQPTEDV